MMGSFHLESVVTKNIVVDSFQGLRNFLGLPLRGYSSMLKKHISKLMIEMHLKYQVKWYRMIVNPLTNGSVMIILYGEGKKI